MKKSHINNKKGIAVFTALISIYIISTAIFYNNYFGVQLTSRLPLLVLVCLFMPFGAYRVLNLHFRIEPTFTLFLSCYFALEIFHMVIDSGEIISVISLAALLLFTLLTHRFASNQIIKALFISCFLYLFIIYPLALLNGAIGNDGLSSKGMFASEYVPILNQISFNGYFKSGRGVVGLMGGVVAILSVINLRNEGLCKKNLAGLTIGILATLTSDSRGSIMSVIFMLIILISPIKDILRARLIYFLPAGIILIQGLGLIFVLANVEVMSYMGFLARSDTNASDITRGLAWNQSYILITDSIYHATLGYGAMGAANALQQLFAYNYADLEEIVSAHNLLLQIILDGGGLLFAVFVIWIMRITSYGLKYPVHMSFHDVAAPSLLSFILMAGITGSVISVDRVNESMFIMLLSGIAMDRQLRKRHFIQPYLLPTRD